MIEVVFVPRPEAVQTAQLVIRILGDKDPLAVKWITAMRKLGYLYRPELDYLFSRPV